MLDRKLGVLLVGVGRRPLLVILHREIEAVGQIEKTATAGGPSEISPAGGSVAAMNLKSHFVLQNIPGNRSRSRSEDQQRKGAEFIAAVT
jgi:hypothetical protein